jgi:cleavage and polyadenylation specificity factor subunit 1
MIQMTIESVASAYYTHWTSPLSAPKIITTVQVSQLEPTFFITLAKLVGAKHIRITPSHPASNGLNERWHRSLKAALTCRR